MKNLLRWNYWAAAVLAAATAFAAEPPKDFFGGNLFPPELVLQNAETLGLGESQREAMIRAAQSTQDKFASSQQKLQDSMQALEKVLRAEKPDEDQAVAALEQVLKTEREIKLAQLALLIQIKRELTAGQQAKLREIQPRHPQNMAALQARLTDKLHKVQQSAQQWQDDGRDATPIAEIMQEFSPLMEKGKHREAEALLDRALKKLQEK